MAGNKDFFAKDQADDDVRVIPVSLTNTLGVAYALAATFPSTEEAGRAASAATLGAIKAAPRPEDLEQVGVAVESYYMTVTHCGPQSDEALWSARYVSDVLDHWCAAWEGEAEAGDYQRTLWGLVDAWTLLGTDPRHEDDIAHAARIVAASANLHVCNDDQQRLSRASVVAGWNALLVESLPYHPDLFSIARANAIDVLFLARAAAKPPEPPAPEVVPGGIVVISSLGGLSKTSAGKDAAKEFEPLCGKALARAPVPADLSTVRSRLIREFPHAERGILTLLQDLAPLRWVHFRPTLISGPAGCGKSRLIRRLADECGVFLSRYDCASVSDSAIGGCPRRWSSGEPSWPLLAIKAAWQAKAAGPASPLIMLDELDKCIPPGGQNSVNGRLDNAVLTMLESETARAYADPYIQNSIDISATSWIATANDDRKISAPLRDRLRSLRIPAPGPEHLRALVSGICADIVAEQGFDARWAAGLDGDELEIAADLWPRVRRGPLSIRTLRAIVERLLARRGEQAPRH